MTGPSRLPYYLPAPRRLTLLCLATLGCGYMTGGAVAVLDRTGRNLLGRRARDVKELLDQ